MKWLIDENLPPDLIKIFRKKGIAALHVNDLKSVKSQKIKDDQIRHLSLFRGFRIVTRDDDFVKSFVDRKVPDKMIFVYGIESRAEVISRFNSAMDELMLKITEHDFIELTPTNIKTPFS
jgi:predicted nuclease of predicted toxin-antitoxin system